MDTPIDFGAKYSVEGYDGVAFYLLGHVETCVQTEILVAHDEEGYPIYVLGQEDIVEEQLVRAVMVGDDKEYWIDVDDLTKLDDDDYCSSCGQIGCGHDGRIEI